MMSGRFVVVFALFALFVCLFLFVFVFVFVARAGHSMLCLSLVFAQSGRLGFGLFVLFVVAQHTTHRNQTRHNTPRTQQFV